MTDILSNVIDWSEIHPADALTAALQAASQKLTSRQRKLLPSVARNWANGLRALADSFGEGEVAG
jgi:hypothetical protein